MVSGIPSNLQRLFPSSPPVWFNYIKQQQKPICWVQGQERGYKEMTPVTSSLNYLPQFPEWKTCPLEFSPQHRWLSMMIMTLSDNWGLLLDTCLAHCLPRSYRSPLKCHLISEIYSLLYIEQNLPPISQHKISRWLDCFSPQHLSAIGERGERNGER